MSFSKIKLAFVACAGLVLVETVKAEGFHGFYLGANVGGSVTQNKYSYGNGHTGLLNGELSGRDQSYGNLGTLGIVVGYNHLLNTSFMLGGELFGDGYFGGRQSTSKNESFTIQIQKASMAYGFLVRAGLVTMPKLLVYVGAGAKSSKSTYTITGTLLGATNNVAASVSKRSLKPLVELGLEGMFCNSHVGWRAAYNYTFSRSVKITSFPNNHGLNQGGDAPFSNFSGAEHALKLGVFYRF